MEKLIDSEKKLKILTGGGVYRNKKLQMGSILPLCKNRTSFMKDIEEYRAIHFVAQFLHPLRTAMNIFKYKPTQEIPVISKT